MFTEAKNMLETDGVIVIKGAQGEGKTTIAKKLVNNPAKCLKINSVADWDMYSRHDVETVLIDDMFGCTMFDKYESRKWLKIFPQLMSKVSNKEVKLIITSRSYILDDAQKKLFISHHIRECNMLEISSKKLEDNEKIKIVESHLEMNGKKKDKDLIKDCVKQSNRPSSFIIGFPECARLFCTQESLFQKGGAFFETPMTHIKACLNSVFNTDEAFLAFFVLWAQPSQQLCLMDLEQSPANTPNYIKDPIEHLAYDLYRSLRIIGDILSNNKDFVYYDTKTETFRFQHQVLGDAVGLVAFEKNKTAVLEYCNASFIERYVCIEGQTNDKTRNGTTLIIIPKRFDQLCLKMGQLIFPKIKRNKEDHYLNCSLLLHPAFKEKSFCATFIETMREQKLLLELLTRPVGTVVTSLLDVQSVIDKEVTNTEIGILVYALSNSLMAFAFACYSEMKSHNVCVGRLETDLNMSMLLAVVEGDKNRINYLTKEMKVQSVDCNIILSAMKKADDALLDTVLNISKMPISQYKREGKNPMIIFVEENNKNAVTCIMKSKYFDHDVDYQNEKDKKTALHIACARGNLEITQLLLTQNPNLQLRDNNNECPIHSAALNGKTEIVDLLLGHDIKQGDYVLDLSDNKRMPLYHLAVWKHDYSLLEVLLEHKIPVTCTNVKKQTPLIYALQNQKFTMIPKLRNASIKQNAHTCVDSEGQTALHLATERLLFNNLNDGEQIHILNETVELLSKDVGKIPNKLGHTPLQNVLKKRQYHQKKLDMHDNVIKRLKKYE
ncbi:uncharacterized protein LOC132740872 [Ruditapes philippinarum]|uniref:uncharacterized protein LOC132740872 n=1 Tax=Ruditapes philippinarum TaxID=129788 RepID=UPI00295A9ADE|nr:uncharacterized protein LOC132740872 [Ruditapes philippinarum]